MNKSRMPQNTEIDTLINLILRKWNLVQGFIEPIPLIWVKIQPKRVIFPHLMKGPFSLKSWTFYFPWNPKNFIIIEIVNISGGRRISRQHSILQGLSETRSRLHRMSFSSRWSHDRVRNLLHSGGRVPGGRQCRHVADVVVHMRSHVYLLGTLLCRTRNFDSFFGWWKDLSIAGVWWGVYTFFIGFSLIFLPKIKQLLSKYPDSDWSSSFKHLIFTKTCKNQQN